MGTYDAVRRHDPALTVRDYGDLFHRLRGLPPDGALWLLLAPRRYGKTWTLRELEHRLGEAARYLDLRDPDHRRSWSRGRARKGEVWFLDECLGLVEQRKPGTAPAKAFLSRCASLRRSGVNLVLALTPRELDLLRAADDGARRVSLKSLVWLRPLSRAEAGKQARTPEAQELLRALPEMWRRTPFMLELLFQVAEEASGSGGVQDGRLLSAVLDACESANHHYFDFVFWDGLGDSHRALLRAIARGEASDGRACQPLVDAGLVEVEPATGRHRVADPVLAAHLTSVRIHHISDVHVGPKSAQSVDIKEAGPLATAIDSGVVREGYLSHLEGLRARGEAPHLVVVSGDLAEWATQEQFEGAKRWLDRLPPLLEPHVLLPASTPRILLVGGNHDVDWARARESDGRARHRPFAEAFVAYPHPHLELPPEQRQLVTVAWPDLGLEILLLGTSELGGHVDEGQERYQLFQEMAKLPKDPSKQDRDKAEELATKAARLDPGLVHARDLDRVNAHAWRQPVRIAVLHHPPSPLPSTEVGRYAGLLNAGVVKQVLMDKGFCLVLCGHVHAGWFAEEHWPGRYTEPIRIAAAPSLGSREIAENNGFNVLEILRDRERPGRRTYKLVVRRFVRKGERSWSEADERLGPFAPGSDRP